MKKKYLLSMILTTFLVIFNSSNAFATVTTGGVAVNDYNRANCVHGSLVAPVPLVQKFIYMLGQSGNTNKYAYYNEHAWETDMLPADYTNVDDVDFAIYSGHGFVVNRDPGVNYNSLHLFTLNSTSNFHTNESNDYANIDSQEIWWGYNASTKWVATFSCNLLNTAGPRWDTIMGGVHQVLGYGSVMYVNSDQGTRFGMDVKSGVKIKDAFMNSNMIYQPTNSTPTICRALYANASVNDTIFSYSGKPVPLNNDRSAYSYLTVTVNPK